MMAARIRSLKLSEKEFTAQVLALAKMHGWRSAHFRPGMTKGGNWVTAVAGDGAGWPDLILCRGAVLVAAELKVGNNKPTPEQEVWLKVLAGAGVDCRVWYPEDWPEIVGLLSR